MTEPQENIHRQPVSIVAIGAGNRTGKYLHYILKNPDKARLVGVVELNDLRRENVARMAGLTPDQCFKTYEDFFANPLKADAVMICTPENVHFEPCMLALKHNYHILLEKPIAQTLEETCAIAEEAKRRGRIVAVCHVLRYHPYFMKMKELVSSGRLGKIVSINHRASVGIDRASHSYVRGIWSREETTNPMLLSKCCHDVDFLVWLTKGRYRKLSSFGSLKWFRSEMAPKGSTPRCVDCHVEATCPFSAVNLYRNRREWVSNFDIPEGSTLDDVIEEELHHGRYGRCVYHCDNNVVDHQVLAMEMDNDITVNLSVDCFTLHDNRETHICLTNGEIFGNERSIKVNHFRGGPREVYDFSHLDGAPFHAGADLAMVEDFVNAIGKPGHTILTGIDESIESHRICYEGERSRRLHRMSISDQN